MVSRSRTIQEHNRRVRWFVQQVCGLISRRETFTLTRSELQGLTHVAFKALVYEVGGTRPRLLLLPSRDGWDPACGCPAYPEDLDTDDWFTSNQTVSSIDHFPGTRCRLANGYDIISASGQKRGRKQPPLNGTLHELFSVDWTGALVVVKRARRHVGRAVHITPPEVSLINVVVERYVAKFPISSRSTNPVYLLDG